MKDRYLIRYSGLAIGIVSGLLVPKILFSYLDEGIVAQALLALGMGALFAFVDLGASRYFYSRLASNREKPNKHGLTEAFSVISFAATLATSLSFMIIGGLNIGLEHALSIALVAALGALSVTTPWYKNLLDGAQLFRRGEWALLIRRLQPLVFTGFIVVGTGLGTSSILTALLISFGVWQLFDRPRLTSFRNAAIEYLRFLQAQSSRFDIMVWSICENLIYNSPMWFAFFFLPVEQQGLFVIMMRIYNFLISIVRAPIEIVFLPIRQRAPGFVEMKKETIALTIRSLLIVSLLGIPFVPIVLPMVNYITNGAISATLPEASSLIFVVVAATVMHPLGLAATSFPDFIAWARVGSSISTVFLFASVLISAVIFELTVARLLLLFGAAIALNATYLLIRVLRIQR